MVWERQRAFIPETPAHPQVKSWFLAAIVAVVFSVLIFVLHASDKLFFLQNINIWMISSIPVVIWISAFCVRSYLFGRELTEFNFLQDEAQIAQMQWKNWAERYMAVIAHTVLLPDKITVSYLTDKPTDFPPQYALTRRIDYLPEQRNAEFQTMSLLLNSITEKLNTLPTELPLNVTILTDGNSQDQVKQKQAFLECWADVAKDQSVPENIRMQTSLPYDTIDTCLKDTNSTIDLLLIMQRRGGDEYSDGLGIFLFTSDDVAQKYQLQIKGRLLRPMTTEENSFSPDFSLFMETQVISQHANGIISDSVKFTALTSHVLPIVAAFGATLTTDDILIQERFTGVPGPFSCWLSAGLGLDFSCKFSMPYLVFAQTEQHWLISTVSSGSNNEIVQ